MGCGGSAEIVELDTEFTPTALGDYILDLEEDKIKRIFEYKSSRPKQELIDVLQASLFFYLVSKNQIQNPDTRGSKIEDQMQIYRNDEKLREKLLPIAKWMLETKLTSQKNIQPDDFAETVGKWFDPYTQSMSSL
mmetsp:Transcript_885/g.721  ORF Transcript_885/g.721 Transcript_885/m.721 type:complete len:135 (+) Transcript_885:1-405(+)|eukprot:CAMPEP_0201584794 /NCGR_PEP_ID=MMETSP0190_2-20130828/114942_1 /ASSEMBLY_ACC=CAM_ASM_000263 /TAXON_ID=37353 /ORGANISM="Rosalina sp." /LENGTH=134 /DNA_ID=CAMNT_0048029495 /DNA_START=114 /DNA_END=518 /DNA_ORIENTATION=-